MKSPTARYNIGSITTKDLNLWERYKAMQQNGETMESIFRRGIEEIEQDAVNNLTQNNEA